LPSPDYCRTLSAWCKRLSRARGTVIDSPVAAQPRLTGSGGGTATGPGWSGEMASSFSTRGCRDDRTVTRRAPGFRARRFQRWFAPVLDPSEPQQEVQPVAVNFTRAVKAPTDVLGDGGIVGTQRHVPRRHVRIHGRVAYQLFVCGELGLDAWILLVDQRWPEADQSCEVIPVQAAASMMTSVDGRSGRTSAQAITIWPGGRRWPRIRAH
jgi:hypothetical protein